jgi:hypothetical protein
VSRLLDYAHCHQHMGFVPPAVIVAAGDTVRWTNRGAGVHAVAGDGPRRLYLPLTLALSALLGTPPLAGVALRAAAIVNGAVVTAAEADPAPWDDRAVARTAADLRRCYLPMAMKRPQQ